MKKIKIRKNKHKKKNCNVLELNSNFTLDIIFNNIISIDIQYDNSKINNNHNHNNYYQNHNNVTNNINYNSNYELLKNIELINTDNLEIGLGCSNLDQNYIGFDKELFKNIRKIAENKNYTEYMNFLEPYLIVYKIDSDLNKNYQQTYSNILNNKIKYNNIFYEIIEIIKYYKFYEKLHIVSLLSECNNDVIKLYTIILQIIKIQQ